LRSFEASVT